MRFIFYHHEPFGPINLQDLYAGRNQWGGSVGRLRVLFWIAGRGHEVILIGNVERGEWKGVTAIPCGTSLLPELEEGANDLKVLVLNNSPDEKVWDKIQEGSKKAIPRILWTGNPVDWVWLQRTAKGEIDRLVCVSHAHRETYRLYSGFEKIEVCYSGVDMDLIKEAPVGAVGKGTVLSLSVPRRTKGFHNLLAAWSRVREAVPEARLRVCGSARMHTPDASLGRTGVLDAELEEEFPDLFDNHPYSTQEAGIEFMGTRSLPEVYGALKGAAVVVVNSNWRGSTETFCRSAVEAQVAGIPVVGASRGSLPEVVANGRTGLLVAKEDPSALAKAINNLLRDEGLRQRLGAAGPKWAKPFADYGIIARDWENIALRSWNGESVPANPRLRKDLLRRIGYGELRLKVRKRVKNNLCKNLFMKTPD